MSEHNPTRMSAPDYRAALAKLGFAADANSPSNDAGLSAAARFFGASPRTGQSWAAHGPPGAVAVALRLMLALELTMSKARALLARRR